MLFLTDPDTAVWTRQLQNWGRNIRMQLPTRKSHALLQIYQDSRSSHGTSQRRNFKFYALQIFDDFHRKRF